MDSSWSNVLLFQHSNMKLIYPLFYPSNLYIYESVMRIEYSFESHIDDVEDEEGDLKKASHFCCLQFGC